MKSCYYLAVYVLLILLANIDLAGQVSVVQMPQPGTISPVNTDNLMRSNRNSAPNNPFKQNTNSIGTYEQDKRRVEREKEERNRILSENNRTIIYDLPSFAALSGTEYYRDASKMLIDMLNGKTALNLKEAVFITENAYFEGKLNRSEYNKAIMDLANVAYQKAIEDGYNWNNHIAKNVMLFRAMSDRLKVKLPLHENYVTSHPMRYDFDDFKGDNDWSKVFISKLLATRKGNCHSLPMLYLILCEAIGAEAYLAHSPSHSYVKIKDKANNWYNLELTNGHIVTDAYIVGSGFISAEAIKSGLYMKPQTKKQTIAFCLYSLIVGYVRKYGYDDFVIQNLELILKFDPENSYATRLKSNYMTLQMQNVLKQIGRTTEDMLKKQHPRAYQMYLDVMAIYKKIDDSGFREMPEEIYVNWLNSMNKEKERQEHEDKYHKIIQLTR